jgi:hypothetical protein
MKKQILIFIIAAISLAANAQKSKTAVSGYGAATAEINNMNGNANLAVGGYGGVLLNHRWLMGAAGSNTFLKKISNGSMAFFQYNTYGLYTEYHINPQSPVHLVTGVMAGAGYLQQEQATTEAKFKRVGEWHYVISPNLGLSVDITRFMRVHTRASYNFNGDPKTNALSKNDLRSVASSVSLVFGSF